MAALTIAEMQSKFRNKGRKTTCMFNDNSLKTARLNLNEYAALARKQTHAAVDSPTLGAGKFENARRT